MYHLGVDPFDTIAIKDRCSYALTHLSVQDCWDAKASGHWASSGFPGTPWACTRCACPLPRPAPPLAPPLTLTLCPRQSVCLCRTELPCTSPRCGSVSRACLLAWSCRCRGGEMPVPGRGCGHSGRRRSKVAKAAKGPFATDHTKLIKSWNSNRTTLSGEQRAISPASYL